MSPGPLRRPLTNHANATREGRTDGRRERGRDGGDLKAAAKFVSSKRICRGRKEEGRREGTPSPLLRRPYRLIDFRLLGSARSASAAAPLFFFPLAFGGSAGAAVKSVRVFFVMRARKKSVMRPPEIVSKINRGGKIPGEGGRGSDKCHSFT